MKNLKVVVVSLVIVIAGFFIWRSLHRSALPEVAMPASGLGLVLAEQTAKALPDGGKVVIISCPMPTDEHRATMDGLKQELVKHKNISIATSKEIPQQDLWRTMGRLTFDQFAAALRESATADAVVSLIGVTSFTDAQIQQLPKPMPKLIVADWSQPDVQRGLNAGVVVAGISLRQLGALPTDNPKTPREWFDRYYTLTTTDTSARGR